MILAPVHNTSVTYYSICLCLKGFHFPSQTLEVSIIKTGGVVFCSPSNN